MLLMSMATAATIIGVTDLREKPIKEGFLNVEHIPHESPRNNVIVYEYAAVCEIIVANTKPSFQLDGGSPPPLSSRYISKVSSDMDQRLTTMREACKRNGLNTLQVVSRLVKGCDRCAALSQLILTDLPLGVFREQGAQAGLVQRVQERQLQVRRLPDKVIKKRLLY